MAAAHQQITQDWWEKERQNYDLLISELVIRECSAGDPVAAQKRIDVLRNIPLLDINDDVRSIAKGLVTKGCIPVHVFEDAMHIAIAAVHGVDFVLTWNFKHIANPILQERIAHYLEDRNCIIPFIGILRESPRSLGRGCRAHRAWRGHSGACCCSMY